MQFRTKVLRGPNLWATFAVVEARVDFSDYPTLTLDGIKRTAQTLDGAFPGLGMSLADLELNAASSVCAADHAVDTADAGRQMATLFQQLVQHLQSLTEPRMAATGFGRVLGTKQPGAYRVAVEFQEESIALECVHAASRLFTAAFQGEAIDATAAVAQIGATAARTALSPSTRALVRAARQRDIPCLRLGSDNLLQLGYGARSLRVQGMRTDRTSAVAESIAAKPEITRELLRNCGLPTVEALAVAATHQLLVVGGRVVAAVQRNRGESHATPCSCRGLATDVFAVLHSKVSECAVEAARLVGLDIASVALVADDVSRPLVLPAEGIVALHAGPDLQWFNTNHASTGHASNGHASHDDHLHASHGANTASQGNNIAASPSDGAHRAAAAIVDSLLPAGQTGRIPLVAITGVNGKTTTTRLIAHIVGMNGRKVGMTCTEGIFIGDARIDRDDCSGPASARAVLMNPLVEAAVLETARGGILRAGLGFDQCDVAVVTNIAEGDHLGLNEIDTPEELAEVKQVIVRAVSPQGSAVLKADDPLVAAMAAHCPGSVVYFCRDAEHPVVVAHRERGGRAVFVRGQAVTMAEGWQEFALLSLERVPLTHEGRVGFQVENTLAAAAAAWALGVPAELIRKGLEEFSASMEKIPGRFNLVEIAGATVIFDYGHNPSSLKALLEAIELFPQQRRLAVYTAAGDRRDCDMLRQGELLGEAFDRVVLYEDAYMRGRQPGEIMALLKRGLLSAGRVKDIDEMQGWIPALDRALQQRQVGDLLLVQADTIDQTVQYVRDYLNGHEACREIQLSEASLEKFRSTGKSLREMTETGQGIWKF